ncbi:MAG: hypothetical protein D6811_05560, partial [Alphaproteobacteria bacterium]
MLVGVAALGANWGLAQAEAVPLELLPGDIVVTRPAEAGEGGDQGGAIAWLPDSPVLELFEGSPAPAEFRGQGWTPPPARRWTAETLGQVFGLALRPRLTEMDGRPATVVDIFVAASSAYGLAITEPDPRASADGVAAPRRPAANGGPDAAWAATQWGRDGGPGAIHLVDGESGQPRLFAELAP